MKRKSIAMFLAVLALTFGLVAVPKESSAYQYETFYTTGSGSSFCICRNVYNVDIWNQVTLVSNNCNCNYE